VSGPAKRSLAFACKAMGGTLVGEPAAYAMAVRNSEAKQRVTHLREKIASAS